MHTPTTPPPNQTRFLESFSSQGFATNESDDLSFPNVERTVRFSEQCILIPEPPPTTRAMMRPRVVTKSYSLPVWSGNSGSGDGEGEGGIVIRVPVPIFTRSPQSPPRSPPPRLSPCLVHRTPSSSNSPPSSPSTSPRATHHSPRRRPISTTPPPSTNANTSTSPTLSPRNANTNISAEPPITIPLRSCCAACMPTTEACIREGDDWRERFSKAAIKRRGVVGVVRTIASVASKSIGSVEEEGDDSIGMRMGMLNVDEVDKRRRSCDVSELLKDVDEEREVWLNDGEVVPLYKTRINTRTPLSKISDAVADGDTFTSPKVEVDDDELFPLPSPRRTPTSSPSNSSSSLEVNEGEPTPAQTSSPHVEEMDGILDTLPPLSYRKRDKSKPRIVLGSSVNTSIRSSSGSPPTPGAVTSQSTFATTPPSPTSPTYTLSPPLVSSRRPRKRSFSLPRASQIFRVGADVLRGVGAMGGSGVGVGVGV